MAVHSASPRVLWPWAFNVSAILGELKTSASKRRIDLSKELVTMLQAHRKAQRDNDLGLVFPSPVTGSFLQKDSFAKREWAPLLIKAGLAHTSFGKLRHTGNTILISQNYSIKLAQSRMGHTDPKITVGTYGFLGENEGRKGANLLGSLLLQGDTLGGQPSRNGSIRKSPRAKKPLRTKRL